MDETTKDWAPARAALGRIAVALGPAHASDVARARGRFTHLTALEDIERTLRTQQAALSKIARSESLGSGALDGALAHMTETAAPILGVAPLQHLALQRRSHRDSVYRAVPAPRARAESGVELFAKDFPGYFRALREERSIAAHDAHKDPRTKEFSDYLAPLGINSMLDAPIYVGGKMIGVVCNEHIGPKRTWRRSKKSSSRRRSPTSSRSRSRRAVAPTPRRSSAQCSPRSSRSSLPQRGERAREVGGRLDLEAQRLARDRVHEAEHARVQRLPAELSPRRRHARVARASRP